MRHYTVNKVQHTVFDSEDEVPTDIHYLREWKDCVLSDWVLADDGCVIQILRKGTMTKAKGKVKEVSYVGTCTGTFIISPTTKMDTSKRTNIYSIGGDIERNQRLDERESLTTREELFVQLYASGMDARKAYLQAFPTKNPHYAGIRAGQLIKTARVRSAMKEELKPYMEALGLDENYVLTNIKEVIDSCSKDDTKLKALFKLADILDMEDKNKTQVTTVTGAMFQGFTPDKLESVERPKEIGNGNT
tara:strand:+ start:232 stop:972 length:741 start_codon:yes stop_codon:yes gene_type:complete